MKEHYSLRMRWSPLHLPSLLLLTIFLFAKQADKLQSLITAAKVPEIEPIWTSIFAKALEGKDVKELLLNVGSGGGAAAPAGGAAPAAGGAAEEAAPEKKEEGKLRTAKELRDKGPNWLTDRNHREGGVRRRHGLRSLRLSASPTAYSQSHGKENQASWIRRLRRWCPLLTTHGRPGRRVAGWGSYFIWDV